MNYYNQYECVKAVSSFVCANNYKYYVCMEDVLLL